MTRKTPPSQHANQGHGNNDDCAQEDRQLFRDAVGQVRQFDNNKAELEIEKPKPNPVKTEEDEQPILVDLLSDDFEPAENNATDYLFFARPGLQRKAIKKLKRGQFSIEAELDLHGMTVVVARKQLSLFLTTCHDNHWRCIRIIHGKGRGSSTNVPVLKERVNHWLPQRQDVLAFCSTIQAHGGTGAVYVLLRSS